MQKLLAPAISLMLKLTFRQKFLLIGLILTLPVAILIATFINQANRDISTMIQVQKGQTAVNALHNILGDIQEHRVLSFRLFNNAPISLDRYVETKQQIGTHLAQVDLVLTDIEVNQEVRSIWSGFKESWQTLLTQLPSISSAENFNRHTQLTNSLINVIQRIGNDYKLILDPEIDSYYLNYMLVDVIPASTEVMSQLRAYGAIAVSQKNLSAPDKGRLSPLNGLARQYMDNIARAYAYSADSNLTVEAQLQASFNDSQSSVKYFLNTANGRVIAALQANNSRAMFKADAFEAASLNAIGKTYDLGASVYKAATGIYDTRLNDLFRNRTFAIALVLGSLALAVYLANAFYLAVDQMIRKLDVASQRMVKGQFDEPVALDSRDELAQVVGSFNNVAQALVVTNHQLAAQKQDLEIATHVANEASRLKSEFVSTMSHELRTPLNAIMGFTGVLLMGMDGEVDDRARYMLDRVESNSKRLLGLINDILDISKIEAGRMELAEAPVVVRKMVDSWQKQIEVLAKQKNLTLTSTVDPDLPTSIVVDRERLTQVAINLLSNAVKFTENGGVQLALKRNNDLLLLQVTDTGVGIPPHALGFIFDEFRQVDGTSRRVFGGTGLGLAIVRNLCRIMGGKLALKAS